MSNRKRIASIAFTGAAAAAGLGMHVGAAAAASTWKTTPASGTISGTNQNTATLQVTTAAGPVPFKCKAADASFSATLSGSGKTYTKGTLTPLGKIKKANFGHDATALSCSFDGLGITANLKTGTSANVSGSSYNSTTNVAKGKITGISASVNNKAGAGWPASEGCHLVVTGSLPGSIKNASNRFVVDPGHTSGLNVTSVGTTKATSCLGLLKAGDKGWFAASYSTSPALTVTAG
jgi:hypothetical protein